MAYYKEGILVIAYYRAKSSADLVALLAHYRDRHEHGDRRSGVKQAIACIEQVLQERGEAI
jgi:hypothetical protein